MPETNEHFAANHYTYVEEKDGTGVVYGDGLTVRTTIDSRVVGLSQELPPYYTEVQAPEYVLAVQAMLGVIQQKLSRVPYSVNDSQRIMEAKSGDTWPLVSRGSFIFDGQTGMLAKLSCRSQEGTDEYRVRQDLAAGGRYRQPVRLEPRDLTIATSLQGDFSFEVSGGDVTSVAGLTEWREVIGRSLVMLEIAIPDFGAMTPDNS